MILESVSWSRKEGLRRSKDSSAADLVLYFGGRDALEDWRLFDDLRASHPKARLVGCSTGGQIREDDIDDDAVSAVAITLERSTLRFHASTIAGAEESRRRGEEIGEALRGPDLAGVFVLSDGLAVNGSEFVSGLAGAIGGGVPISGGLAGDGPHFVSTLVGADSFPRSGQIAAIGFYGAQLRFGAGSAGGWSVFGPRRVMTRSESNVLFELDGEKALDLYERYLGPEDAADLPASALIYPLRICDPKNPTEEVVRTVLGVDRLARSMTFAGDMPKGWTAQLMRGSRDRLVAGADLAARQARLDPAEEGTSLAVMISCIGRRLLMGQSTVDEVEAVCLALGPRYHKLGFYSYGEISPHSATGGAVLHNQTMTLMTLAEAA